MCPVMLCTALSVELQKYEENDPELFAKMEDYMQLSKDAANRWTDAIFTIKSHVRDKFNIEEAKLNKEFGIPNDMDYID